MIALAIPMTASRVARADTVGIARHATAYRNQPPLAYVSGGQAFVLDGKGHRPRAVQQASGACCLAWAPDGAHFGFQRGADLWITRADGTGTRRIAPQVQRWAWSPDGDAIAVIPKSTRDRDATGIDFYAIELPRARVTLLRNYVVLDMAWAGLGRRIAVSAIPAARSADPGSARVALFMLEVAGPYADCRTLCPEPGLRVVIDSPPADGGNVYFAAWSPDLSSLAIWTGPAGTPSTMDGFELSLMSPSGGPTTPLAQTAVKRSWIQWSKPGDRLLVVHGRGQDAGYPYDLDLCVASTVCRVLNAPAVSVVDPAWSDDGRMAYVTADFAPAGDMSSRCSPYEPGSRLWVADNNGNSATVVASNGAAAPSWLPDGRHLLFVRRQTLWLLNGGRGDPVAIAGPLGLGRSAVHRSCQSSANLQDGDQLYAVSP